MLGGAQVWNRTLWMMRIACPVVAGAALALTVMAVRTDNTLLAAIDGAIFGINAALTDVQWRIFKIRKK